MILSGRKSAGRQEGRKGEKGGYMKGGSIGRGANLLDAELKALSLLPRQEAPQRAVGYMQMV